MTASSLNWERAREIAEASGKDHCLPLRTGPRRRNLRTVGPAIEIGSATGEPLLTIAARPSDKYLQQLVPTRRKLASTIRWLDEQLGSYTLEIRWTRKRDILRYAVRHPAKLVRGSGMPLLHPVERPPREAAEVAAAARRGSLRLNCVHVID
jgi:hypothetical protein